MESGTEFTYLVKATGRPTLFDIYAISSDFMMRLPESQRDDLVKSIEQPKSRNGSNLTETYGQDCLIHAYIFSKLQQINHKITSVLAKIVGECPAFSDISIIDFSCGIGLYSLAFIDYLRSINRENIIKEVILVEQDETLLSRAEFLVHSFLPNVIIRAVNKADKDLTKEDVFSEHIMVFHLAQNASVRDDWRYLFSTEIRKDLDLFYSKVDFKSVWSKDEFSHYDSFSCYEGFCDKDSQDYDEKAAGIISFIRKRNKRPSECYYYFHRLAKDSLLARLNHAICLIEGVGTPKNKELGISELESLIDSCHGDNKSYLLRREGTIVTDHDKRIDCFRRSIELASTDNLRCASRYNTAILLKASQLDNKVKLLNQCIQYGCDSCHECNSYDSALHSCPRAQYSLSLILLSKDNTYYDTARGIELLKESARQGNCIAQNFLGLCYEHGTYNLEKGKEMAAQEYENASKNGSINGAINYFRILKDKKQALYYLLQACGKDNKEAINTLLQSWDVIFPFPTTELDILKNETIIKAFDDGIIKEESTVAKALFDLAKLHLSISDYDAADEISDRLSALGEQFRERAMAIYNMIPDSFWDARAEREELEAESWRDNYDEYEDYEGYYRDAFEDDPSNVWNID